MSEFMKRDKMKQENGPTGRILSIASMERLSRAQIESKFGTLLPAAGQTEIPEVEVPDLDLIRVDVNMPAFADESQVEAELHNRLADMLIRQAHRVGRKVGEALKEGDQVLVDIVSYLDGLLSPFASHEDLTLFLEPGTLVPGFAESMVGVPVGAAVIVVSRFPDDFPDASLRGKNVSMSVRVKSAQVLQFPSGEDGDAFQGNRDELVKNTLKEIVEEQGLKYRLDGVNLALEKLAEKATSAVTEQMLDAALNAAWIRLYGNFLRSQDVPLQDREDAMRRWLGASDLREEMRKRLAVTLAVKTVAKRHGLSRPSREELDGYLQDLCGATGVAFEELSGSIVEEPDIRRALGEQFVYARTIDFIADHVHLAFHVN